MGGKKKSSVGLMRFELILVSLLLILITVPTAVAQSREPTHIISNSEDWQDVYSVVQYANLNDISSSFLVSDRHGPLLLNGISRQHHLWIVSSASNPHLVGYQAYAESRGFTAEEFSYPDINLELARQLPNVRSFVIIDDAYGYNAISVAPYAAATESYVLFANEENIGDVVEFLNDRNPSAVLIYGTVDREVLSELELFSPDIINDDGDRFANNIEIVKRYQEIKHAKQAILTNGEFIEQEIMSGSEPVVFIGTTNVPDIVREYIRQSEIDIGVLIGNELVGTATSIRRQIGISVFVKFAQGARAPQGAINQVEALDMFYLPIYNLQLELREASYNRATGKLEITLFNPVEQAIYFKGTYGLEDQDGNSVTVGDGTAEFIGGREAKTLTYDVEGLSSGDIVADIFVIYGESRNALEKVLDQRITISQIDIIDRCEVELGTEAIFQKNRQLFRIPVTNVGPVDCYVDGELIDVRVAGVRARFGTADPVLIKRGAERDVRITTTLEEEDLEDNEIINVRIFFGEREGSLVNSLDAKLNVTVQRGDVLFYSLLIIIILLLIFIVWKRHQNKNRKT